MRIFEKCKFTKPCPICKTKKTGDAILIGVRGTEEGNIMQAELFHIECIELTYHKEQGLLVQKVE